MTTRGGELINCRYCGREYRRRRDSIRNNRGFYCSFDCSIQGRFGILPVDDAELKRLYVDEDMTLVEIGAKLGIDWKRVHRRIVAQGIPLRNGRRRVAGKRSPTRYRRIANAGVGQVVHHLNCRETDDRPDNLVLVSRPRHAALHKQLEQIGASLFAAGLVTYDADGGYALGDFLGRAILASEAA